MFGEIHFTPSKARSFDSGEYAFAQDFVWVTNGTRTRDVRHHKPALYQLSYGHHVLMRFTATPAVVNT